MAKQKRRKSGRAVAYVWLRLAVFLAALTGCAAKRGPGPEEYRLAGEYLERAEMESVPPATKEGGGKFRIAYVDIDPYPPSGEMLYYLMVQLEEEGWIHLDEDLPFDPQNTDAGKLIDYLAGRDLGPYLEFDREANYYLSLDGEESCRESLSSQVQAGSIDLILCMGTWPGKFVKEMGIQEVPIMVYFCVDPVGAGICDSSQDSGQDNLWCHVNDAVYQNQIKFYHDNFGFQKIGVVYYDEAIAALRQYRAAAEREGFALEEVRVEQMVGSGEEVKKKYYEELTAAFERLSEDKDVDAFLLGTDILKDEEQIDGMLDIFYRKDIPVFVQNGEYFVSKGALMMITASDAREQAPFVVHTMASILRGKRPRDLVQEFLPPPYLSLNLDAADKMGYEAPQELILSAEKIYGGMTTEGGNER